MGHAFGGLPIGVGGRSGCDPTKAVPVTDGPGQRASATQGVALRHVRFD